LPGWKLYGTISAFVFAKETPTYARHNNACGGDQKVDTQVLSPERLLLIVALEEICENISPSFDNDFAALLRLCKVH